MSIHNPITIGRKKSTPIILKSEFNTFKISIRDGGWDTSAGSQVKGSGRAIWISPLPPNFSNSVPEQSTNSYIFNIFVVETP